MKLRVDRKVGGTMKYIREEVGFLGRVAIVPGIRSSVAGDRPVTAGTIDY
jgi:hypothetical protein